MWWGRQDSSSRARDGGDEGALYIIRCQAVHRTPHPAVVPSGAPATPGRRQGEREIEVQVGRFAAAGRDGMDLHTDERGWARSDRNESGLFVHFTAGCGHDVVVFRLDVAARLDPPLHPGVENQDDLLRVGRKHNGTARDVAGIEAAARKRCGMSAEQGERALHAGSASGIGTGVECGYERLGALAEGAQAPTGSMHRAPS